MTNPSDTTITNQLRRLGDYVEAAVPTTSVSAVKLRAGSPTITADEIPDDVATGVIPTLNARDTRDHRPWRRRRLAALAATAMVIVGLVGIGGFIFGPGNSRSDNGTEVATGADETSTDAASAQSGTGESSRPNGAAPFEESGPQGPEESPAPEDLQAPAESQGPEVTEGAISETAPVEVDGDWLPLTAAVGRDETPDPAVGVVAPTFSGQSFDGSPVAVDNDGTARVIMFVAHWCPVCDTALTETSQWLASTPLPPGVELVAVSTATEGSRENYPPSAWFAEYRWPAGVVVDDEDGTLARAFGVIAYPFFVVVDSEGVVIDRISGLDLEGVQAGIEAATTEPIEDALSPQQWVTMSTAAMTLGAECVSEAGYEEPLPTDEELVQYLGQWAPHEVFSVGGRGTAEQIGYQRAMGWNGQLSPSMQQQLATLRAKAPEQVDAARQACASTVDAPAIEADRCCPWSLPKRQVTVSELVSEETDEELTFDYRSDPGVTDALDRWRTCVEDAVGETAATPAELALTVRAFDGNVTDREREVAVADITCQYEADLWHVYQRAAAAAFSEGNEEYESEAERFAEEFAQAEQILAERGITPVSLDE